MRRDPNSPGLPP